jgi:hypothetical protein
VRHGAKKEFYRNYESTLSFLKERRRFSSSLKVAAAMHRILQSRTLFTVLLEVVRDGHLVGKDAMITEDDRCF